jgi:hypothetical protein
MFIVDGHIIFALYYIKVYVIFKNISNTDCRYEKSQYIITCTNLVYERLLGNF